MAMRKLFRRKQIHDLIEHPERLDVQELISIAHSVFAVQTAVGTASFVRAAITSSISLVALGNLIFPVLGLVHTKDDSPGNFRVIRFCAGYWVLGLVHTLYLALVGSSVKALLVGALKLVLFGAQWMVLARLWRILQDRSLQQVHFYCNMVIKNKADAITMQLKEKHPHAGGLLGRLAGKIVTDDKFTAKLAAKVVENIPVKMMNEAGLTVLATKEFQKGNFLVIRIDIQHVDVRKLVLLKGGTEKAQTADFFVTLASLLPTRIGRDLEYAMRCGLAAGLLRSLPEKMTKQMQELGGVEVDVEARSTEDEADFLFAALKQLERSQEPLTPEA